MKPEKLPKPEPKSKPPVKSAEQNLIEAQIERAKQETTALKKGKKSKRVEPEVSPGEAKRLMEAAFRDQQARKEFARLVGRPDMVPEDPRAQAILTHIASAPSALRQDPDWLVMQGNRLRETLRADMPGEERYRIASALRTMYRDVVTTQGIDMSDPAIRVSKDPRVQEKVQLVQFAGNVLLPEAGQVTMPDSGGGDADEFKVEAPEFTLVKDPSELDSLQPDLKKELEGIQRVLKRDPLATGDRGFIHDQIKALRTLAKKSEAIATEAEPYLKKLHSQLSEIQEAGQLAFGKGEWLKVEAEAASYQQRIRRAYEHLGIVSQQRPEVETLQDVVKNLPSGIVSTELEQLLGNALSDQTSSELGALQTSLDALRSRTAPNLDAPENPKLVLTPDDRATAGAVAELVAAKKGLAAFRERYIGDLGRRSDEDLKYFFRHLSYEPEQTDWIFTEMSRLIDPQKKGRGLLRELGMQPNQARFEFENWQAFEKNVERHFNIMFEQVHKNPSGAWEEWFTMFYHRPAYQTFMARLDLLKSELLETYNRTPEATPYCTIDGKPVKLTTLVDNLYEKMRSSYDFQEYCHNAFYILTTRGDLKTLAGYANRLRSDMVDFAFSDPKVQAAYHYYEQILRHELAYNQWRVNPTWFQFVKEAGGVERVEKITSRVERIMREQFLNPDGKNDWEIQRALSIARGSLFGVTSVGLDLLGEGDAPMAGVRWSGYFGERLLITWNVTRHFFYRWWPSKAEAYMPLLYNKMYRAATGRPWDPNKLNKWHDDHHSDRLTSLRNYKDGVLPFIQQSNWLNVGGSETRGGWRLRASVIDIFNHIPLKADEFHTPDYERLAKEHLNYTRHELEKAGLNYLYFWADMLDGAIKKGDAPQALAKTVEEAGLTLRDVYLRILKKDPLFFITRDSTLWDQSKFDPPKDSKVTPVRFKDTIRGRAILKLVEEGKLGSEWRGLVEDIWDPIAGTEGQGLEDAASKVGKLRDGLDRIEEDLMKATELLVKKTATMLGNDIEVRKEVRWVWDSDITRELIKKLGNEQRVRRAFNYYDKILKVVQEEKIKVTFESRVKSDEWKQFVEETKEKTFLEEFEMREVPYTVGTVTKNWDFVKEAGGGQGVQARALDDALKMSEGVVNPMLYFNYKLADLVDSKGDWSEIDKYLKTAREAITYVHGQFVQYDRFSHDFNELTLRHFQKAWWARLPLGLGNTSSVLWPGLTALFIKNRKGKPNPRFAANSQKTVQNPMLMAFDEQRLYARIRHLIDVNLLSPDQGAHLMKEMGATGGAMIYDTIRSYFPWVAGLAVVAGFATARKDQEEK